MKLCSLRFCSINLLLVFALLLHTISAQAQTPGWQWVQGGGGGGFPGSSANNPAPDYVWGSAIDQEGNMIVGGATSWTSKFDTITFGVNTNWQNTNFFLAKYDKCGNVLWARVGGGDGVDLISALDVDAEGNIYVLAEIGSSTVNIHTPQKDTILTSGNYFFARFDPNGNLTYIKADNGTWGFEPRLKRLRNGLFLTVIYKTGGTSSIGNFPIRSYSRNFILLDSLGNFVKGALIDTLRQSNVELCSVVSDERDNIYFSLFNPGAQQASV